MIKINSSRTFFHKTLNSNSGMALMMVIGVIALLTFLLADFTFETKLNKIKVYNQQDKIQARLNAESGINFALAKLRMYQEGRNKIEKDESIKGLGTPLVFYSFPVHPLQKMMYILHVLHRFYNNHKQLTYLF